jgi:hypothetical protein
MSQIQIDTLRIDSLLNSILQSSKNLPEGLHTVKTNSNSDVPTAKQLALISEDIIQLLKKVSDLGISDANKLEEIKNSRIKLDTTDADSINGSLSKLGGLN